MIYPPPEEIIYNYAIWQPIYDKLQGKVKFSEGISNIDEIQKDMKPRLWILDDQLYAAQDSQEIVETFTRYSHHLNISIVLLTQNLFSQGKHFRTISLNTQYMFILKSTRDTSVITTLGRQMFPSDSKFLIESYKDATSKPFGYLFIDLKASSDDKYRLRSNIFSDVIIVYLKK